MRKLKALALATALSLSMASTAFAGSWKQDIKGSWYQEDDGTYPTNTWKEVSGKWYYFKADGYTLISAAAPDGKIVGSDGVWTGEVQPQATLGMQNALKSAQLYLKTKMGFSYNGLVHQLKYEGFTNEEAAYGANNCGADWNNEAAVSAEAYMKVMGFSKEGLQHQLEFEEFTPEQAAYGVASVGY